MLRSLEAREKRQQTLKEKNDEVWDEAFLTLNDCAQRLNIGRSTAHRLFRREPGVELIRTPGSHRPIIRVPRDVLDRVVRRSANPYRG